MNEPAAEPEQDIPLEEPEEPVSPEEPEPTPEPTEEPEAPQEPSEGPSAPSGDSESQMRKNLVSLEKEATRHANRVSEIMGEAASVLEPCPRCAPNIPGFIFPPALAAVDDEQKQAVLASVGMGVRPEYRTDPDAHICETCDGWGVTLSGSHVVHQETINCVKCGGKGWIGMGPRAGTYVAPQGNGQPGEDVNIVPERPPDSDPWGRTPEHPDYGRMPQYVRS